MTDKNLADECERLAICRAIDPDYRIYTIDPAVYPERAQREFEERAVRVEAVVDRVIAALRASAAPQPAENGFDVDGFSIERRAYLRRVFPDIGERGIVSIANEAAAAAATAYAAGQAARAKRDIEVAKTFQADCCLDCGLALTSPIIVAQAIEKDAAG